MVRAPRWHKTQNARQDMDQTLCQNTQIGYHRECWMGISLQKWTSSLTIHTWDCSTNQVSNKAATPYSCRISASQTRTTRKTFRTRPADKQETRPRLTLAGSRRTQTTRLNTTHFKTPTTPARSIFTHFLTQTLPLHSKYPNYLSSHNTLRHSSLLFHRHLYPLHHLTCLCLQLYLPMQWIPTW